MAPASLPPGDQVGYRIRLGVRSTSVRPATERSTHLGFLDALCRAGQKSHRRDATGPIKARLEDRRAPSHPAWRPTSLSLGFGATFASRPNAGAAERRPDRVCACTRRRLKAHTSADLGLRPHYRSADLGPGGLMATPTLRWVLVTVLGDTSNSAASRASDHPSW